MSKRRIVVTGLGAVTPVGLNVDDTWRNILAGKSGIGPLTGFDTSGFSTCFGGEIRGLDISLYINPKDSKRMDGFIHYGMAAGIQAIRDSGIEIDERNADRIGVAIGAGIGGITGIESGHNDFLKGGARKISPFFVPGNIINMISGNLSIQFGLKGPNFAIVTACTTGTHNIGEAARIIGYGDADVM
ncbi:MAG: beta-ketoacyl synthase N-terminal-like domain-containing protein, partial [Methylococcales bacterium]